MDLCILRERLKGIIVPVTTPFNEKFEIDYDALETLMKFYLDNGLKCFIAAGSTGECYVLTAEEHEKVVKTIVNTCKKYKDTFVLGACSHTSTAMSNKLADICQDAGVDGLLLTPPYYLNHSDMCPVHYRSVAKNHDIPLIIYHNKAMPEDMSLWEEFVKEPNILGVKFATHNIYMARQLISKYRDRLVIYGGGSMLQYLPMALHGSPGYVGGFCNFMPQIELDFMKLMDEGHIKEAARLAELEFDLFDLLGSGNWFNFLVALINASGLPGGHCRPPLPDWPSGDVEKFKRFLCEMEFKYDEITHANNQQG